MLVEAFVAKASIEALDEGVLGGLARLDEVESYLVSIGPGVEGTTDELGPVVGDEAHRVAADFGDGLEHTHDSGPWQGRCHLDGEGLPRAIIDDVERTKAATIGELIARKVEAPALVGSQRGARWQSRSRDPLALSAAQISALPVDRADRRACG